jgi:hypothetical protein
MKRCLVLAAKGGKTQDKKSDKNPGKKKNPSPQGESVSANGKAEICPICGQLLEIDATKCNVCGTEFKSKGGGKEKEIISEGTPPKGQSPESKKKKIKKKKKKGEKGPDKKQAAKSQKTPDKKDSRNVEDEALAKWLSGEAGEGALQVWLGKSAPSTSTSTPAPSSPAQTAVASEGKDDALKAWLTGEAGGEALEEWLSEEPLREEVPSGAVEGKIAERKPLKRVFRTS